MAKVQFTAIVSEVTGRLAGSVFQRSVGGHILHSLAVPINRRTQLQQRVRSSLAAVTSAWRNCSEENQASWEGSTNRERFNNYTSWNFLFMWLTSSRQCLKVPPTPVAFPYGMEFTFATSSVGENFLLIGFAQDGVLRDQGQWYIRISKPRQFESQPAGPLLQYRSRTELLVEDDYSTINLQQSLIDYTDEWELGQWVTMQIVLFTGATITESDVFNVQVS